MQCRKCGNSIHESDSICRHCGEVLRGDTPVHYEEFSWTVHDFSKPKKVEEEVKMEWPKEPERPRRNVNLDEPISFDIDMFKKRSETDPLPKEEAFVKPVEEPVVTPVETPVVEAPAKEPAKPVDASPEQKLQELAELTQKLRHQQNVERQAAAQSAMNNSRATAAVEAREESLRKADPFFDFSKTNMDFQELLDQEYAKLQKMKQGVPYVESHWKYHDEPVVEVQPVEEAAKEEPVAVEVPEANEPEQEPEVAEVIEPVKEVKLPVAPEDALEQMIFSGTRAVDPDSDATIKVDLSAIKKAAAKRYGYETEAELNGIPVELVPEEEPVPVVKQVEDIIEVTEPETPEVVVQKRNTMTEMERAREEYFKMLDQEMTGVQVKVEVNTVQDGKVITDVDIKPGHPVEVKTSTVKFSNADAAAVAAAMAAAEAATHEQPKVEEPKHYEEPKRQEPIQTEPEEEMVWPLDPSRYEEEEERGGCLGTIGKFLLLIIGLVILLELGALAVLYFAPDSSIGGIVGNVQDKVLGLIDDVKDKTDDIKLPIGNNDATDETSGDESQAGDVNQEAQGDQGSAVVNPNPNPMTDKAALIQTQMGKNKNIKSIKANSSLGYKSGVDYGLKDLNNSKPITNNIWYTDDQGNPVYYDQAVVGTLISFNSQWVDYVNTGDKAVLKVVKEGSDAYNNTVNFSKAGKVKEEFTSMEIGEIRQGEQGFYLWAKEEIKLVENGTTSTANYQWVYCMEPVGKEMKIVDYISVKNK